MKRAVFLPVVLTMILSAWSPVAAQDPFAEPAADPSEAKLPADPEVAEIDDEKAKELLDALDEAVDTKSPNLIIAAIEPFVTARNKKALKPLEKLARHREISVRVMATKALGSQTPAKKVGMALLKILTGRQNKGVSSVLAMAVSSLRRVKFDHPRVMKELEGHFVKSLHADVMAECARYFGDLKKIEMIKKMIQWIEAPQPASVNSGSNPPASYWKKMWEIWNVVKLPVRLALKKMTGREFETEAQWRNWLDSREAKELGIR